MQEGRQGEKEEYVQPLTLHHIPAERDAQRDQAEREEQQRRADDVARGPRQRVLRSAEILYYIQGRCCIWLEHFRLFQPMLSYP